LPEIAWRKRLEDPQLSALNGTSTWRVRWMARHPDVTSLPAGERITRRYQPREPAGGPTRQEFEAAALPHADALYRTAYHLARRSEEAEDLTQETYLRAYRAFDGYRGGNIRSWLFAILRHVFLDECRRRGRRGEIDIGEAGPEIVGIWEPSAETEALRAQPSEALERAFVSLPPDWRMMVMLADVEELSYREIAEIMGVPQGTVMSRLHRARKRLRENLLASPRSQWRKDGRSA